MSVDERTASNAILVEENMFEGVPDAASQHVVPAVSISSYANLKCRLLQNAVLLGPNPEARPVIQLLRIAC